MKKIAMFAVPMMFSALVVSQAQADERPPEGSKSLAEIAQIIESKGYTPITEISMDDGVWEVEAYLNNVERELRVNPMTGEVLSDRRDR
ncbi:MAG: PepSY domain-containing protein [Pseudomonadota bacterium]|nr:PepSY domain-containing protein [Pseudomonadota bacterium]